MNKLTAAHKLLKKAITEREDVEATYATVKSWLENHTGKETLTHIIVAMAGIDKIQGQRPDDIYAMMSAKTKDSESYVKKLREYALGWLYNHKADAVFFLPYIIGSGILFMDKTKQDTKIGLQTK